MDGSVSLPNWGNEPQIDPLVTILRLETELVDRLNSWGAITSSVLQLSGLLLRVEVKSETVPATCWGWYRDQGLNLGECEFDFDLEGDISERSMYAIPILHCFKSYEENDRRMGTQGLLVKADTTDNNFRRVGVFSVFSWDFKNMGVTEGDHQQIRILS